MMVLSLPGRKTQCCVIHFVPARETGSIFDGSGYFSARRINEAGEPIPEDFVSSWFCSPVIHSVPASTGHQCKMRAESLAVLISKLKRDGWQGA
jgi:hypothetical protein